MSLVIRMARAGTKKRPFYHIVVADSRSPRDGRFIERLGFFNPLLPKDKTERLTWDIEKAKAWIAKGAQPSDRVMRFLDAAGVMKRTPRKNPDNAMAGGGLVCLGQIGAPHGVRGEVRLHSFTADPAAITSYGPLETVDGR